MAASFDAGVIFRMTRDDVTPFQAKLLSLASSDPVIESTFDVYLHERELTWLKRDGCGPADTEAIFFLHIVPVDTNDLPPWRRRYGFDNINIGFDFDRAGASLDGQCLAVAALPGYAIDSVRTGQYVPGEGDVWTGSFDLQEAAPRR